MDKYITMSQKEVSKYDIIKKLINNELNGTEAASILNLTTRHIRRLKKRVEERGAKGLVHKNRNNPGNRKIPEKERDKIIKLINQYYSDFKPGFATEKLEKLHKIKRDKGTIRSIMITEGFWKPKYKKQEKHRTWRQRRANYGEMLQYDGSYEYWFEDRALKCCLLAAIDDATSRVWLRFDKHEGVAPTFNFWREHIKNNGKPYSIYVDRFSTYSMNHKIAKENSDTLTQFERAMSELGIEIIHAHSPQAKGRVERLFRTLQDRLIKELRLRNISDIKTANKFLEDIFLPEFNARFNVMPRNNANLYKKITKLEINKLDSIFSRQYYKVVRNDFTISHNSNWYQITKNQSVTICKKDRVIVEEHLDNSIKFKLRGKYLNYELLPDKPKKVNIYTDWVIPSTSSNYKPLANHPWRQIQKAEYLKKLTKMSK